MNQMPARADHPIHKLLRERWSSIAFDRQPIEHKRLLSLFEAARWAPSSYNEQPWRFVVGTRDQPEAFDRLLGCLVDGNRKWAQNAAALVIAFTKTSFQRNGKPNPHARYDLGLAMANLTVQATSFGFSVHQMAGFDLDRARTELGMPDGFEPVVAAAIGTASGVDSLTEDLRAREISTRWRKPLAELVFSNSWGRSFEPR